MPHINLPGGQPGMQALSAYRPDVYEHFSSLANLLLHEPSGGLSSGDRELIATYVSSLNSCDYCVMSHGAVAAAQLGNNENLVNDVARDYQSSDVSPKLKALFTIAGQVSKGGKNVSSEAVEKARDVGATDMDIHDTVLIASAFCMFNRYVDGLDTLVPSDLERYRLMAPMIAKVGYGHKALAEAAKAQMEGAKQADAKKTES